MTRLLSALLLLSGTGCAALADSHEFRHRPTAFGERETIPDKAHEPCRVYIVDSVPAGSRRLGTIDVPEQLAKEKRVDAASLEYACELQGTHAVKQEEIRNARGEPFWKMSLYRVEKSFF